MMGTLEKSVCTILLAVSVLGPSSGNRGDFYKETDPTNIQLPLNDETVLTCEMNLAPDHFQWRFYTLGKAQASNPNAPLNLSRTNFVELPQNSYRLEKKRSTLIVKMTNFSMAGDYQCLAHYGASIHASVPDRITLTTLEEFPPQRPMRIAVTPGNTILWRCEPPYSNPSAYIDYSKDGSYVLQTGVQINSLILSNVTQNDSGTYKCKATNTLQQKYLESTTSLDVYVRYSQLSEAPKFVVPPKLEYAVKKGDTIFIECGAVGNPVPKVTWTKVNGQLYHHRTEMLPGGLLISNIVPEDKGVYNCMFSNSVGKLNHSINLVYQEAPVVTDGPRPTHINEGEKLELDCTVRGNPEPQISWLLNGKTVVRDQQINVDGNVINFVPIEKRHAGVIQCFASNTLGVTYSSATLIVNPKQISSTDVAEDISTLQPASPNHKRRKHKKQHKHKGTSEMIPPSKPTISRLNDESVVVRWSVPSNDGLPILFFKVQYRELGPSNDSYGRSRNTRWKTTNLDIAPNIRSFEVNNLKPDHVYKFRIAAVYSNNDNMLSPKSEKFHLVKEEFNAKNPLPIPTLTHSVTLNATSIQIFWESTPSANVTVDGYFINYMPASNAGDYTRATVDGEKTNSFVITHLAPDTVYDIKMQSFNTKSASEFSQILKQKTKKITTEAPKVIPPSKTKELNENNSEPSWYIMIGVGVLVIVLGLCVITSLIICKKWKQNKETSNSRGTDRTDKPPTEGINHHIQAEGNDYVVTPKTLPRNNGCAITPNRITITANPLADADNKSQNMIEMSCLSSQNNNCTPSASTQEVQHSEQSVVVKGKHKNNESKRQKHIMDPPPGENYV